MSKRLDAYIIKQDAALIADTKARIKHASREHIKAGDVRCQDVPMIERMADRLHTERLKVRFDHDRLESKLKHGNAVVAAEARLNLDIAAEALTERLRAIRTVLKLRKRTCRK